MNPFFWYNTLITIGALLAIISYIFLTWKNKRFHVLAVFLTTYIAMLEIICRHFYNYNINNLLLYNFGFVLAEVLILLFMFHVIFRSKTYSKILLISAVFFILYFLINAFYLQPITIFQSYSYMVGSLLIIGFSLLYFYEKTKMSNEVWDNLMLNPEFWTVSLTGLFFTTTIFVFTAMNSINESMSPEHIQQLFGLIRVVGANMYLGIGAALLICSYLLSRSKKMT